VPVGAHVDRCAIDMPRKVGAMVKVKSTQKILVGFARSRMLGGDQARDVFGKLANAADRTVLKVCITDDAFRTAGCDSDLVQRAAIDDDFAFCRRR